MGAPERGRGFGGPTPGNRLTLQSGKRRWIADQVRNDESMGPSVVPPRLLAGFEQVPECAVVEGELLGAEQQGPLATVRGVRDLAEQLRVAEAAGTGVDAEPLGGGVEHIADRSPVRGEGQRRAERAAAPV